MSHGDKWLTLISSPFRRGIFKIIVFECQSKNKKPVLAGIIAVSTGKKTKLCHWQESNLYSDKPNNDLNVARLPIPPQWQNASV